MSYDAQQLSEYGGAPIVLFRFASGPRLWLRTNAGRSIQRGAEVYEPVAISHGDNEQNLAEGVRGIEIRLPSSDSLAREFVPYLPPEPITVRVFSHHLTDEGDEYKPTFIGECAAAAIEEDGTCVIQCYPIQHKTKRTIPWPTYCATCNWAVYSVGCGVDRELYKTVATVTTVNEDKITSNDFAAHPDKWFDAGFVVRVSNNDVRWVIKHVGGELTLASPFPNLQNGEQVYAYAGCDGLEATCKDKFNNLPRHVSFPDVPRKNPFVDNVFGTGNPAGGGTPVDPSKIIDAILR